MPIGLSNSENERWKMRGLLRSIPYGVVLLVAFLCLPQISGAQSGANTGQIVGQIVDQSGASVAGADVTIRNKDTNFIRGTSTDTAGRYAASYLPLGRYEVSVR